MRKKGINILLFIVALVVTALFYGMLSAFFKPGSVYQFFSNRGWYQQVSVLFFIFGLLILGSRWWAFRDEIASADMPIPNAAMSREDAAALADQLPPAYRDTILGRRLANLLKGYVRGEELGPLGERLAVGDRDELDHSESLVGWIRSLPPLAGLMGTLDGLRGGIAEISRINNAGDLEEMRRRLQLFAGHASLAFDTTLLGIGAAVILSALIFLVRRSEREHLLRVDRIAEELTRQLPRRSGIEALMNETASGFLSAFLPTMEQAMAAWLAHWQDELSRATNQILDQHEVKRG